MEPGDLANLAADAADSVLQHCAGVAHSRLLAGLSADELRDTLAAKVAGTAGRASMRARARSPTAN